MATRTLLIPPSLPNLLSRRIMTPTMTPAMMNNNKTNPFMVCSPMMRLFPTPIREFAGSPIFHHRHYKQSKPRKTTTNKHTKSKSPPIQKTVIVEQSLDQSNQSTKNHLTNIADEERLQVIATFWHIIKLCCIIAGICLLMVIPGWFFRSFT